MKKGEIIEMAKKYSKDERDQKAYIAGVQACCSIVFQKFNTCYNEDFCSQMEALSEACFIEFD
ncbi:hypothetical protein [Dysgonomonas gadei]|uniref:hypothetical protein n=1 Tax=Dysgonomonas gadei TaxID=156974 RepID=UPI003AF0BDF2